MEFDEKQDDDDDIRPQSNDPEIDPFRVLIYDKNYILKLDYQSPTFHGKKIDFVSFLQVCTIVSNEDSEPPDFTNIQIVLSLKIMNYLIDIGSCRDIFCISVSVDDVNRPVMKANPLNAICTLYSFINLGSSYSFDNISFDDQIITKLYNMFSTLSDPHFAEYISIVSPFEEIFCSFGKTEIPTQDYFEVWDEALSIASDLDMSDQHVLSNDTDYLAVFSFLPCIKVVAIFSEEALNFSEPEEDQLRIQTNNAMLMDPFISKLNEIKQSITPLYKLSNSI